mgnify:CR=1 FL=1
MVAFAYAIFYLKNYNTNNVKNNARFMPTFYHFAQFVTFFSLLKITQD